MFLYIESSWKMDDVLLEERGHDSTPSRPATWTMKRYRDMGACAQAAGPGPVTTMGRDKEGRTPQSGDLMWTLKGFFRSTASGGEEEWFSEAGRMEWKIGTSRFSEAPSGRHGRGAPMRGRRGWEVIREAPLRRPAELAPAQGAAFPASAWKPPATAAP